MTKIQHPAFVGIVLAAGASSRMGTEKALLQYAGQSFLTGAIELLQIACDFVVVVTGNNTDLLRPLIEQNSAYLVRNWQPELGQFSSLRLGLQAVLDQGCDTACLTLVDRPPARVSTLLELKQRFLRTSSESTWAVVPQYEGKRGHPVIFGRKMIEALLRANPNSNARDVVHQDQNRIEYVVVDDARVELNINTPEQYSILPQPAL
jgi:molybdenum cofactor cytidylyltransferase